MTCFLLFTTDAFLPKENKVNLNKLSLKEITVYNPASILRNRMETVLTLMFYGKLNLEDLITYVIKEEYSPQVYRDFILSRKDFSLGIAVDWKDGLE